MNRCSDQSRWTHAGGQWISRDLESDGFPVVSLEIFDLITFRFSQNQTHFGLHVQRVSDGPSSRMDRRVLYIEQSFHL